MRKPTGLYPLVRVDAAGKRVVSQAIAGLYAAFGVATGSVVLALTADKVVLGRELSAALAPWRRPIAVHDPGKVLLDLAISLSIGGDCLADIGQLRAEPAVFGLVAPDPTASRLEAVRGHSARALVSVTHWTGGCLRRFLNACPDAGDRFAGSKSFQKRHAAKS